MHHLNTRPAQLLLFVILAGSTISVSSGCATTPQSAPPTATAQPKPAATPSPTATSSPTPQPTPQVFTVGDTGGQGAYIRRTPLGDRIKAWPDGTVMTVIGGDQIVDGNTWRNVSDPEGNEGWMLADLLVPQESTLVPPIETPTAGSPPTSATPSETPATD